MEFNLTDPLASHIVTNVAEWERWRDNAWKQKWGEYYRIWRGIWSRKDSQRAVERSKIIAPATQQAIEAQVAELEESLFARKRFFELEKFNPTGDPEADHEAAEIVLDFLLEDLEHANIKQAVTECILNGALYGTGIAKVFLEVIEDKVPNRIGGVDVRSRVNVGIMPIDPMNFVIDPAATTIEEAQGVAHVCVMPRHIIEKKQADGVYRNVHLGDYDATMYDSERDEMRPAVEDKVEIIEWHGLVPRELIEQKDELDALNFAAYEPEPQKGDMVEVICIIANRTAVLAVHENPFLMQDRGFVAFQFDTVPNRFWGRGVAEKAYNAQKALDTEIRARIDALSLSTYPITIVNTLLAPRNLSAQITPGKRIAVNGSPGEAVSVLSLPGPDPNSYRHANDLERMVQSATGSFAPASPLGVNPTNETSSGMSMILGTMFKRSKRTLRNIEEQLLEPMITKAAHRYMQFDEARYPFFDYKFLVKSGLSASAKEFEVAQLAQFLQTMQPGTTEYFIIMRAMLENFNLDAKDELLQIVNGRIDASTQPAEPSVAEQIAVREVAVKEGRLQLDTAIAQAEQAREDLKVQAEAERDLGEAEWNRSLGEANRQKAQAEAEKSLADAQASKAAALYNLARASEVASEGSRTGNGGPEQ